MRASAAYQYINGRLGSFATSFRKKGKLLTSESAKPGPG